MCVKNGAKCLIINDLQSFLKVTLQVKSPIFDRFFKTNIIAVVFILSERSFKVYNMLIITTLYTKTSHPPPIF